MKSCAYFVGFISIFLCLPVAKVAAVQALPGGAWSYSGLQMAQVPQEIGIPLLADIIAVAGGETHSVALSRGGQVFAWGSNSYDQCRVPLDVESGVTAIAAGARFTAALKEDGEVRVWGGGGTHPVLSVPTSARSGVTRIAAGRDHLLALKGGAVLAWGMNAHAQCEVPPEASGGVIAMAAGDHHSLALKEDGSVLAWGAGSPGSPAEVPHNSQSTVPQAAGSGVVAISAALRYSAALKEDGSVIGWGGTLPAGEVIQLAVPGSGMIAISGGRNHFTALNSQGRVFATFINPMLNYGQVSIPEAAMSGVTAIAAGSNHTLALKEDGTVVAWGAGSTNHPGLMIGDLHGGQSAVPNALADDVETVAASFTHTLALTAGGGCSCLGKQ